MIDTSYSAGSQVRPADFQGAAKPQGAKVLALLDGTEEIVEPFLICRVDTLEKARTQAGTSLEAAALVYRTGVTPGQKALEIAKCVAKEVLPPVLGAVCFGPVGLAVGLGVAAMGVFTGNFQKILGEYESAKYQRELLPGGDWQGKRTYVIQADQTDAIDSPAATVENGKRAPQASELRDFMIANMAADRSNIVFFSGHGLGYRSMTSMPVTEIARSMQEAVKQTGTKPDVIVAESCLMGNLEALNAMKDVGRVAILSEEVLNVMALPVQEMMVDAAQNGGTAREIGKRMIDLAEKEGKVKTLAAFDLEKVPQLMESMDKLGTALCTEIAQGHKDEILDAMKHTPHYPQGLMQFLNRAMLHFSDLGGFLDNLQSKGLLPDTIAAAKEARESLDDTIIARTHADDYATSSGLSFQDSSGGSTRALDSAPGMSHYGDLDLPKGWSLFMSALGHDGAAKP